MFTQGEWNIVPTSQPERKEFWIRSKTGRNLIARITRNSTDDKEAEDNARLIAEAGTVCNETGFTPKQLAEHKADLLAACKLMVDSHGMHGPCEHNSCSECRIAHNKAREAINKAENK